MRPDKRPVTGSGFSAKKSITSCSTVGFSLPCDVLYLSLAVLRERTIARGELERQDESGLPLASIQAAISAIPSQTRHMMVQEVQTLEDDTLKVPILHIYVTGYRISMIHQINRTERMNVPLPQQLEDIHVVVLHKDEGTGLGFSIAGGSDLENKAPTVRKSCKCSCIVESIAKINDNKR